MYLCFESDDKRLAFPEASLVGMDDNGFILKTAYNARTGDTMFVKITAYQGSVQNFKQALAWIRRAERGQSGASLPENPNF